MTPAYYEARARGSLPGHWLACPALACSYHGAPHSPATNKTEKLQRAGVKPRPSDSLPPMQILPSPKVQEIVDVFQVQLARNSTMAGTRPWHVTQRLISAKSEPESGLENGRPIVARPQCSRPGCGYSPFGAYAPRFAPKCEGRHLCRPLNPSRPDLW